jgi:hypothetical protein
MAWWWWVVLWIVLVLAAAAVMFLLGRSLWRKAKILMSELSVAAERLSVATQGLQKLAERSVVEAAVFTPATQLRQERILAGRRSDGKHTANRVIASQGQSAQPFGQRVR